MSSKDVEEKFEALQEVAKEVTKSTVAHNTLSAWIKNKDEIIQSYKECG